MEILKRDKYPQYKILFEDAANCEVGSSPMIYVLISEIIINIISENACEKIMDMDIQSFTNQFAKNIIRADFIRDTIYGETLDLARGRNFRRKIQEAVK